MVKENIKQTSSSLSTSSHSTSALHTLQSPDGYYTYLQIPKEPATHESLLSNNEKNEKKATIDKVKVEKNYRRLSLKLHPDRPGGDAETFRMLERAKSVLMSDKLRKEYDLLGLDLEEEEDNQDENPDESGDGDDEKKATSSSPDSVMSQMASATVAAILQLAVRTAMMAFVSLFLTRYKYITFAAMLVLTYSSFQIFKARKEAAIITIFDSLSPIIIGAGIFVMHFGRIPRPSDETSGDHKFWSWMFWSGESLVLTMFALNTVTGKENSSLKPSLPLVIGFYVLSLLICLYLRGKTWRYLIVLAFELTFALLAVIVFPIMEMILEEIMNEKLKKVGHKVRQYSKAMEESYNRKLEDAKKMDDFQNKPTTRNQGKIVELD